MSVHLKRVRRILLNGFRLRCPRCGQTRLFRGAFAMHEVCARCGLRFEREQGYFVGAIYINYAVTTLSSITGYLLLDAYTTLTLTMQLVMWSIYSISFPLWFFRYARSLWLAIDFIFDPEGPDLRVIRGRPV